MSYPAIAIANFFIEKSLEDNSSLSPLKLMKLIYIAHGWCLALLDKELIDEPVQAWKYGPVIESVYHEFKYYGHNRIDSFANGVILKGGKVEIIKSKIDENDKNTFLLLERVWDQYKNFTGIELSKWSHKEGGPWYKSWHEDGGSNQKNHPIPNSLINDYFSEMAYGNRRQDKAA